MSDSYSTDRRPLGDLQPSQLLVSAAKLRAVLERLDADDPPAALVTEPLPYLLPVADLGLDPGVVTDGRVVLMDGHTRALAAVLTGVESVPVARASGEEVLSTDVYRTCVGWCLDEGVREPADLVGRVVSHDRHREAWVERCQALVEGSREPG